MIDSKYGLCPACNKPLQSQDHYNHHKLCGQCRVKERQSIAHDKKLKEIEACGYEVLSLLGREQEYKTTVKCLTCGKIRNSYYKNIVKNNRKCSCKYSEEKRALIEALQTKQTLIKVGNEFTKSGIYRIDIDNHFYVGSSNNIKIRLRNHFKNLRDKTHKNIKMMEAFTKDSKIKFCILEECDLESLYEREQHYIDTLKPTLNILDDAKNPMQDIKLKFSKLQGENNISCIYTNEKIKEVFLMLLGTKDLKYIADKTDVGFNLVADISAGKAHTWLQTEFPNEYKKHMLTRSSKFSYNQIVSILTDLANNAGTFTELSEKYGIEKTVLSHFKSKKSAYMKRLNDEDETVKSLYSKIVVKKYNK